MNSSIQFGLIFPWTHSKASTAQETIHTWYESFAASIVITDENLKEICEKKTTKSFIVFNARNFAIENANKSHYMRFSPPVDQFCKQFLFFLVLFLLVNRHRFELFAWWILFYFSSLKINVLTSSVSWRIFTNLHKKSTRQAILSIQRSKIYRDQHLQHRYNHLEFVSIHKRLFP